MLSTVTRALPPIVGRAACASPIVVQRVMAMRQSTPNIQRRDFSLIGSILQFAIDATIITSSMSVLRRTIGLDMHQFAQTIRQPEIRRVTLNKIISLKDYTPRYGNPPDQSYNRWDQQRRDRNDKNQYY